MHSFKAGDSIFFANGLENKIESRIILGVDMIDDIPRYCLLGYFGYFYQGCLFKTHIEAKDYLTKTVANNE